MRKKLKAIIAFSSTLMLGLTACSSTPKNYELPSSDQFQGYTILDSVERDTVSATVKNNEKIAVALRDIVTTSYSFIEPRYSNSMVHYDGASNCCHPNTHLIGNSGLAVYKFSFIGKGQTTIHIIARQKGLSAVANHFETDHDYEINVNVE